MDDRNDKNMPLLLIFLLISIALLISSSLGIFDVMLSVSDHIQSNYRVGIRTNLNKVSNVFEAFSDIAGVKRQRDQYKSEIVGLKEEIAGLKLQLADNKVINEQLQNGFGKDTELLPARIIRFERKNPGLLIIDRGEDYGIQTGDIVVFNKYAVGEVFRVEKYTSYVRTVISGDSNIPVISERNAKGILVARNGNELEVEKVLSDSEVQLKDDFFTIGINSNYPAGLYVGEVSQIDDRAADTTKRVRLSSELDFGSLKEVFILRHEN